MCISNSLHSSLTAGLPLGFAAGVSVSLGIGSLPLGFAARVSISLGIGSLPLGFAAGVSVSLGIGGLPLGFAAGVSVSSGIGGLPLGFAGVCHASHIQCSQILQVFFYLFTINLSAECTVTSSEIDTT